MVLQAFIDESFSDEEFVLAGHIATAESWANFAKEWEQLLPAFGTLNDQGKYHFKMSEMAQSSERMDRVPAFYKVIEDHIITSISARVNLPDFEGAHERFASSASRMNWTVNLGLWTNPYFVAFRVLLDGFHTHRKNFDSIPIGVKIDFIFDERAEKTAILQAWGDYLENREDRDQFGAAPRFENDQEFLPLQAADLWAWWAREWYEEDASHLPDRLRDINFGGWRGKRRKKIALSVTEDQLFEAFQGVAVGMVAQGDYIFSTSLGPILSDDS
jgi:hypothetical protein